MIQRNIELGYGTVTKEAMQNRELSIEAKAIYAYLCSFAGGKDEAWPSISKMLYDLHISENRFRKHFNLLLDYEYIERSRRRFTNSKQWASNVYSILK